jgi:hypothetical protein
MKPVFFVAMCLTNVLGQAPDTQWTKTFDFYNAYDCGTVVRITNDGGYIITGYAADLSVNIWKAFLLKTDSTGNEQWRRTTSYYALGFDVKQTSDKGYIITGWAGPYENSNLLLIKTDSLGNEIWNKSLGGAGKEWGHSVLQTDDGGYLILGSTDSYGAGNFDIWLIKTDSLGNQLWTKTFGGSLADYGNMIQKVNDGYIIVGTTKSFGAGDYDVWLIKIDTLGNERWNKTYGGSSDDEGTSVDICIDGGYIITGWTWSYGAGGSDVWIIKTDSLGDSLWTKTYGGTGTDAGWDVKQTSDGGYLIIGYTYSFGAGEQDIYLIRTDSLGNRLWDKTIGGAQYDEAFSGQLASDGGYILVGETNSFGNNDVWLIKIGPDVTGIKELGTKTNQKRIEASSNPFRTYTKVSGSKNAKVLVYDIHGRFIGEYPTHNIGGDLRAGVYFVVSGIDKPDPIKVVKIK